MSGRVQLRDSIRQEAKRSAVLHRPVEVANVTAETPLTVKPHHYGFHLTSENDFFLSQWAKLYDHVVGIKQHDLVLLHKQGAEWVLFDVVSDADVAAKFDAWDASKGPS